MLDKNEIVEMRFPDGFVGRDITVEMFKRITRRAKIGYYVEAYGIPMAVGAALASVVWKLNETKITAWLDEKIPQWYEKFQKKAVESVKD